MDRKTETLSYQRSAPVCKYVFSFSGHLSYCHRFPMESSFSDELWTCYWGFIPWPWVCMARSRWLVGHTFCLRKPHACFFSDSGFLFRSWKYRTRHFKFQAEDWIHLKTNDPVMHSESRLNSPFCFDVTGHNRLASDRLLRLFWT